MSGLTTLPHLCADCLEIWEPQTPVTSRPVVDLYRDYLNFACNIMPHISPAFSFPCFPVGAHSSYDMLEFGVNPLKPELNPICYLLALLGAHHFLHVSRIRVKLLTLR